MYRTLDNIGRSIEIPETADEDFPYFKPSEIDEYTKYYRENGYVVVRGALDPSLCEAANSAFDEEVLPSNAFMYRQTTGRAERHQFTAAGFVLNPLLNVQSVHPWLYPKFRVRSTYVITDVAIQKICSTLFGRPGKVVQSMYFHGNPSTWPHQDIYYLDSTDVGVMVAAWIAAEDIPPGAGRFFVCPESHKMDMAKNGGDFDFAYHHDRYKQLVATVMEQHQMRVVAPALRKGDVLFWSAKTIHGSLPTTQPDRSRRSFTTHWIPADTELLQFQSRVCNMRYEKVNGGLIARPKDLSHIQNLAALWIESNFPKAYGAAKKAAIKLLVH